MATCVPQRSQCRTLMAVHGAFGQRILQFLAVPCHHKFFDSEPWFYKFLFEEICRKDTHMISHVFGWDSLIGMHTSSSQADNNSHDFHDFLLVSTRMLWSLWFPWQFQRCACCLGEHSLGVPGSANLWNATMKQDETGPWLNQQSIPLYSIIILYYCIFQPDSMLWLDYIIFCI